MQDTWEAIPLKGCGFSIDTHLRPAKEADTSLCEVSSPVLPPAVPSVQTSAPGSQSGPVSPFLLTLLFSRGIPVQYTNGIYIVYKYFLFGSLSVCFHSLLLCACDLEGFHKMCCVRLLWKYIKVPQTVDFVTVS